MKGRLRLNRTRALIASAILTAAFLTGCAVAGQSPTASGCATSAVRDIRARGALKDLPYGCSHLAPASMEQAVRIAVAELSDSGDKAIRRHLAGRARAQLAVLISAESVAAAHAARKQRTAKSPRAISSRPSSRAIHVPIRLAALVAWLLTAGSGGVLLAKWRAQARRRAPDGLARASPAVALGHAGLAICGLACWLSYLVTGQPAFAWLALCVLLPVAGLGIATLMQAIPDPDVGAALSHEPALNAQAQSAGSIRAVATAITTRPARMRSGRPPVVMIITHGVLATATLLLALLGSVAALGAR
jgi:hypothetical protein